MSDDIDCDKCDNKTTSLPQAEVIVAQIYFINIELKADVLLWMQILFFIKPNYFLPWCLVNFSFGFWHSK